MDQQIEADLASLAAGLKGRELKPLHTACDAFVIDADTLYDELPAPDTLATNELAGGLTTFASAGLACSAAPSFGSPSFAKYEELLKKGESEYKAARSRVAAVRRELNSRRSSLGPRTGSRRGRPDLGGPAD